MTGSSSWRPSPFACAVVMVALVAGAPACAARAPRTAAPAPTATPGRLATRVLIGDCIFAARRGEAAFLAPILAAVLPSLISKGVNALGQTLEAAGKEQVWQAAASANFEIRAGDVPKCVIVIRGMFAPSADGLPDAPEWARDSPYAPHTVTLKRRGVALTAKPELFLEGLFRSSSDKRALSIVPVVAAFEKPLGRRALRGEDRHVKVTFAFHPPGKSATAPEIPSAELVLGHLTPGDFRNYAECPEGGRAAAGSAGAGPPAQPGGAPGTAGAPPPFPSPQPATQPAPTVAPPGCVGESLWFPLAVSETLAPLSVTSVVSEVQGADAFLAFVADVFKDSKDRLETLAKQALIDAEREKARLAALQGAHDLAVAYDQAVAQALVALDACAKDGTAAKAGEARVKQQSANLAAEKAGRTIPFDESRLVPLSADDSANKAKCSETLTSFRP